jgi:hypothetical protein
MQALEPGTVATSNNRQQSHHQPQWAQSMIITMDEINAFIVMGKSALETRAPPMQQGESWQSSLEPQGGLANKHNKGIMRTL